MATTSEVENYPAIEKISGPEFSMNLYQQALAQGAEVRLEEVEQVSLEGEIKTVVTTQGTYTGKTCLLYTSIPQRMTRNLYFPSLRNCF